MNREGKEAYLIKTSNPVNGSIMTYKTTKNSISIGSDSSCELIIGLPSVAPVHLIVNFSLRKIKAVGNDVRVDYTFLVPDSSTSFNNSTLISIHNIFFMFLAIDDRSDILAEAKEAENKLLSACSKYLHYSPYLKITPSAQGISLAPEYDRNIQSNREGLSSQYKKEMGEFAEMPPLSHMTEPEFENPVVKRIEEEFEHKFDVVPAPEAIAAVINSEISDVKDNIQKAMDGITDIKVVKETLPDLGKSAIQNEILSEAKKEIETREEYDRIPAIDDNSKIIEAELKSIDDLKNSITDKIKEEFRSAISDMIQEETKEHVEKEVERCFQEPKFAQFVSETVVEQSKAVIEEFQSQIEDLKETQEKFIEVAASALSSEQKEEVIEDLSKAPKEVEKLKQNKDKSKKVDKPKVEESEVAKPATAKAKSSKKAAAKTTVVSKKKLEDQESAEKEQPAKKSKKTKASLKNEPTESKKAESPQKSKEVEKPKGRVSERKQSKVTAKKSKDENSNDTVTLEKPKVKRKTATKKITAPKKK